jgi:acyl carrier protein
MNTHTDPVTDRIISALRNLFYLGNQELSAGTRMLEDLGLDNLDVFEAMLDLEADFGRALPDTAPECFQTIGDVIAWHRSIGPAVIWPPSEPRLVAILAKDCFDEMLRAA